MLFRGLNEREISKEDQTREKVMEGEGYADIHWCNNRKPGLPQKMRKSDLLDRGSSSLCHAAEIEQNEDGQRLPAPHLASRGPWCHSGDHFSNVLRVQTRILGTGDDG